MRLLLRIWDFSGAYFFYLLFFREQQPETGKEAPIPPSFVEAMAGYKVGGSFKVRAVAPELVEAEVSDQFKVLLKVRAGAEHLDIWAAHTVVHRVKLVTHKVELAWVNHRD